MSRAGPFNPNIRLVAVVGGSSARRLLMVWQSCKAMCFRATLPYIKAFRMR